MVRIATFLSIVLFLAACSGKDKSGKKLDTPTSGHIRVAVDESVLPLMDAEAFAFNSIYSNAKVDIVTATEHDAVDMLLKDSVKLIVITRKLTPDEEAVLQSQKYQAHQVAVATGGIALIVHPENSVGQISTAELARMLSGDIKTWDQLGPKSKIGDLQVVFDQPNSGVVKQLSDSLGIKGLSENCFAVKGNPGVVEYVSSHKNALGLIDVTWISDGDDSTTNVFLNTIKVLGVKKDSAYFQPFQAYLAQKSYPLLRRITMVSREARAGLASGFIAYVAGDKGQRVVLKAGLVPATMPVRIVQINNKPLL
jgi:phosphate transport system substrate-binding protein